METNHEVVFVEAGVAELAGCSMPEAGPDQLLIRTRATLISPGTERAWFLGMPNTPQIYPQRSGYCNVGEVVEVGADVEGWAVGDRVASRANHVRYAAMDAERCSPVPAGASDEHATFHTMVSIAMQGVRKARVELGEPVAVIGGGLIGLLAMQVARLNGALPAIVVDREEGRLDFAVKAGADAVINAGGDMAAEIKQICDADGASVVIEATGHPDAILSAFELARPHGRVILLGSTRGETENVNFYRDVHKKGLTVIGAHDSTRPAADSAPGWWTVSDDQRVALNLLAADRLRVEPLITHRFAWRDIVSGYDLLTSWNLDALGMVVDWTSA